MKGFWQLLILMTGTFCWWGFVYPQLCLTGENYETVYEADGETYDATSGAAAGMADSATGSTATGMTVYGTGDKPRRAAEDRPAEQTEQGTKNRRESGILYEDDSICIKCRALEYVFQIREQADTKKDRENE